MKTITRIADAYTRFARWVAVISGIAVVIVMLYTTVDVTGRYLAKKPMPAAFEFTTMFLIYITYFGVTLVQARGGHMRLGFLWERSRPRGRAVIDLISAIFGLFIVGIITWQGWLYAIYSWQVGEVTMGLYTVPLFPGRIALAIGATVFVIQYIIDVIRNILMAINPAAAPTISGPGLVGAEAEVARPDAGKAGVKP